MNSYLCMDNLRMSPNVCRPTRTSDCTCIMQYIDGTWVCRKNTSRPGSFVKLRPDPGYVICGGNGEYIRSDNLR